MVNYKKKPQFNLKSAKSFLHDLQMMYIARERIDYFSIKDEKKYDEGMRKLSEVEEILKLHEAFELYSGNIFLILEEVDFIVFVTLMSVWNKRQSIAVKNGENCNSLLPCVMQILIEKMFNILVKIEKKLNDFERKQFGWKLNSLNQELLQKSIIIEVEPYQICRKTPK